MVSIGNTTLSDDDFELLVNGLNHIMPTYIAAQDLTSTKELDFQRRFRRLIGKLEKKRPSNNKPINNTKS